MNLGKFHVVLGGAALTALLSGCIAFTGSPAIDQIKKKPKVALTFTVCKSNGADCPNGNANSTGASTSTVLVGLRVPKGTKAPQQFNAQSVTEAGSTSNSMVRDSSFKSELNQKAPKGNKFKWFGYVSEDPADTPTGDAEADFRVKLGVPDKLVGKKFKAAATVGWTTSDLSGGVDCGPDPFDALEGEGANAWCIDYPSRADLKNVKVKVKPKN
jgi:hypothetical protein